MHASALKDGNAIGTRPSPQRELAANQARPQLALPVSAWGGSDEEERELAERELAERHFFFFILSFNSSAARVASIFFPLGQFSRALALHSQNGSPARSPARRSAISPTPTN